MKRFIPILPGILAGALAAMILWLGLFSGPERFFEDILFSKKPVRNDIVILAIDNKSLTTLGQWPWKREMFANMIDGMAAYPPRALGIDVIFAELSRYGESDDATLARAYGAAKFPIVQPVEADPLVFAAGGIPVAQSLIVPRTLFKGPNVETAHVNLIIDPDGVVRSLPMNMRDTTKSTMSGEIIPAFSARVSGSDSHAWVSRIAFSGPPGTIQRISFSDALASSSIRAGLAGKYVMIGATASDLHDEQLTPFSRGVPMPGVEIQAQIAQMLLSGDSLVAMSRTLLFLWIFLAGLIPAVVFIAVRSVRRALLASVILGFIHLPIAIVLFGHGVIGNILNINLAWIFGIACAFLLRHFVLEKEKREIRNVFSKYVSKDVLEDILRDTTKVKLGGEEKEATVFFSDVRGFTTLSERLTPIQLTQFLNRYLTVMTNLALDYRGVVDKYIGDAIMVFWGAPLDNKDHMYDAMEVSLVMIEALHAFNAESAKAGEPPIDIGIGFNSGRVVAGNMGSEQRFDYTVMGDTVNLASRLESQTKTYGIHIITSEFTMALTSPEEIALRGIHTRELDRIRVKGKKLPVTIYEIVERAKTEEIKKIGADFDACRTAYYAGDWKACIARAETIVKTADDGPTKVLAERAHHFMEEPPENWEGVYDFKTKYARIPDGCGGARL